MSLVAILSKILQADRVVWWSDCTSSSSLSSLLFLTLLFMPLSNNANVLVLVLVLLLLVVVVLLLLPSDTTVQQVDIISTTHIFEQWNNHTDRVSITSISVTGSMIDDSFNSNSEALIII
jgi:uncharacterized membrane protein YjdF